MKQSSRKIEEFGKKIRSDLTSPPREILVLSSSLQTLHSNLQSLLHIFTQCYEDRSKFYQDQLKQSRERSNIGTRNALQAEKGAYHSALLQLKEQHAKELRELTDQNMKSIAESEERIRQLTKEFSDLREETQLMNDLKRQVRDMDEKLQRAVLQARQEENHRAEERIAEIRAECQEMLREADNTLSRRRYQEEEFYQEKLDIQKQHQEEVVGLVRLEREKLEKQNQDLIRELSLQREQVQ
jgi:hypothetical protein